ncbi:MAG: GNAT family N-acetyltransferase [Desulfosarcinaceae bacterium]|nr:GNAT family N-acetyltransferase [Desulfosarcinaceae bacterium]
MLTIDDLTSPSAAQIGAVARLYAETGWWPEAEQHPEQVHGVITGSLFFMVAREGADIVGMGRVISDGVSDAFIHDIAVTAGRRGEGIATQIVAALVDRSKQRGIDWIGLIAKGPASGVYARCGFQPMTDATPMRYLES